MSRKTIRLAPITEIRELVNRLEIMTDDIYNLLDRIKAISVSVSGYTQLGDTSPKIKIKKLSVNTATVEGGVISVAHGLTYTKIISVNVIVWADPSINIPPSYIAMNLGFQYEFSFDTTTCWIQNHPTNSENILNKPVTILVTYEE